MRFVVTNNFSSELEGCAVGDVIELDGDDVPAWGLGKLEQAPADADADAEVSQRKHGGGGKGGGKGGGNKPAGEAVKDA